MRVIPYKDKNYNVDEQGFLLDFNQWDENFATLMASTLDLSPELSEKHWAVIGFIRKTFNQTGKCPLVYETCRANGLTWMGLRKLFPTGYQRGVCLIAGITYKDRLINYYGEQVSAHPVEKGEFKLRENVYQVDADGFLIDPSNWDEEYAFGKAVETKLPGGLSDKHWKIIHFLHDSYKTSGTIPTVYECCESNGIDLDEMEKLFPDGYHRGAVKISGLRLR